MTDYYVYGMWYNTPYYSSVFGPQESDTSRVSHIRNYKVRKSQLHGAQHVKHHTGMMQRLTMKDAATHPHAAAVATAWAASMGWMSWV
jgi:hypothetical protein